ncbi:uncharacterized protein SAPINGB_P002340 [Magnusiomyces paraingens]|uniref:RING-type domain-containing protein n=1 Tax=Magnusiomyces paraingens TaxID=2606893 RepID=A0A5E8BFH7_9ASCO|nr:uncharacterized protein SAPINGB_P002340 [Saprochaete ingens]VVT49581.1 unnamed protein product [Saprochaete ingens]
MTTPVTTPGTIICSICLDLLASAQSSPALSDPTTRLTTVNTTHDIQKEIAYLSGCCHNYHDRCISIWANTSNTCPTCRARFGEITVRNGLDGDIVRTYPVADKRAPSVYYPESRDEISAALRATDSRIFSGLFGLHVGGAHPYVTLHRLQAQLQNHETERLAIARGQTNSVTPSATESSLQNHRMTSSFQTHCQICGTSEQATVITTCPGCQYSFHPECLQEGLEETGGTPRATEDWFMCPSCNITTFIRNHSAGGVVTLDEIVFARGPVTATNSTATTARTRALRPTSRPATSSTTQLSLTDYYDTNDDLDYDFSDIFEDLIDFEEYDDDENDSQDLFMQTSHHTGAVRGGTLRLTSSFMPTRGSWASNRPLRERPVAGRRRNGSTLNTNRSEPEPAVLLRQPTHTPTPPVEVPQLPEEEVLSWRLFEQARAASEQNTSSSSSSSSSSPSLLPQLPSTSTTSQVSTFPTPGVGAGDGAGAGPGATDVNNNTNTAVADGSSTASSSGRDIHGRRGRTGGRAGSSSNNSTVSERAVGVGGEREQQSGVGRVSGCSHGPTSVTVQSTPPSGASGTRTAARHTQTSSSQDPRVGNSGASSGSSSDTRNRVCKKLKRPGRRRSGQEAGSSEHASSESRGGSEPDPPSTASTESSSSSAEPTQIQMLLNSIRQPTTPSVIFASNSVGLSSSVSMTNLTTTGHYSRSPSPPAAAISGSLSSPTTTLTRAIKITPPSSPPSQQSNDLVLRDISPLPPSLPLHSLSRSSSFRPQSSTTEDVEMNDDNQAVPVNDACGSSASTKTCQQPHSHFSAGGSSSNSNNNNSRGNQQKHRHHHHGQRHKRGAPPLSARDKTRLQELVRDVLRPLYRAGKVTKTEYTEINKRVSRAMYRRVFSDKVVSTRHQGTHSEDYEKMEVLRGEDEGDDESEEEVEGAGEIERQGQGQNERLLDKTRTKTATVYVLKYTQRELARWKELAGEYVERECTRRREPGSTSATTSATSGAVAVAGPSSLGLRQPHRSYASE